MFDILRLLSTVDLNSHNIEEFFNPNHDSDGKFAPTSRGGAGSSSAEVTLKKKISTATKIRTLSGGRSGASVELLSGPNGKVIRKSGLPSHDVDKEYLVSKVGRALGANVPPVSRLSSDSVAADYVSGGKVAGTFRRDVGRVLPTDRGARKQAIELKGARELALLDVTVRNVDRHGGNILIKGKIAWGIDHTGTFGQQVVIAPAKSLEDRWKSEFKKADYTTARKKVAPLKRDFDRLGRTAWFNEMNARLVEAESKAPE